MQIHASVNYHVKKDEPQAFEFEADGIIGNLVSPELETTKIVVHDVRGSEDQPTFRDDGIEFFRAPSRVSDFEAGSSWHSRYDLELKNLLQAKTGATEVIVFDHTVRVDEASAVRRPARNVHCDYSKVGAEQRLLDLVGEARAEKFHEAGYGFVNVWRPVSNIIRSSPLGFIRPASVQPEDWMDINLVYPDRVGQILGLASNPDHEWFYKSQMSPDDVVIFNIYDNKNRPSLAHGALDFLTENAPSVPRKSVESRTLVRFS